MINKGFYIPSLDGLRAVAVMLVFIAHAGFGDIVPGGFGVTIFFFLSGYLITTLLRMEFDTNKSISLKKFYLRRVYRIFPALYLVLILALLLCLFGVFDYKLKLIPILSQFFHFTNYQIVFGGKDGMLPALGVLWSLAVEEHFYLVYPLLFIFLKGRMSYRSIAIILAVISGVVLGWRYYLVYFGGVLDDYRLVGDYAYTYYATDTRVDSLLYGCIMALFLNPAMGEQSRTFNKYKYAIIASSLVVLLVCFLVRGVNFRETLRYTLQGWALFPIFYFSITESRSWLFRWLNWRFVEYFGKISYVFYLSHYILIYLSEKIFGDSAASRLLGGFLLSTIFASLVYFYVEKRFALLRKKLHS